MAGNVFITGANGGVGSALSKTLVDDGWRVLAGVRSESGAAAVAKLGNGIEPVELDITDDASVASAARTVAEAFGAEGLQGLVNNAGVIVQGQLELVPIHALHRQFEVNVVGQVAVTQALLPLLRRGKGTIVNMGAASGRVTVPMLGPISASKTALESLTDALRMELKHQGVGVTIIEPGAMQTAIFDKAAASAAADGYAGSAATRRLYARAVAALEEALANQKTAPVDGVVKTVVEGARVAQSRAALRRRARRGPAGDAAPLPAGAAGPPADEHDRAQARGVRGERRPGPRTSGGLTPEGVIQPRRASARRSPRLSPLTPGRRTSASVRLHHRADSAQLPVFGY
jgi:NAD(P)-dependent dehydrogenase (short-subunit alcohol dehydrogenase family)